jgi:hypothetical protein
MGNFYGVLSELPYACPNWEPPDDDEQLQDFGWAKVQLDMSRPEGKRLHNKLVAVFSPGFV